MSKYKFSVVIPIYNVEQYLEETIESVVNQSIGFEENIQMILVNDGSPDDSESICLKYRDMYPENVVYVKQENSGVSAARNNGLKYAEGEYVNFLDSDDKWELDAFKKVYKFFSEHKDEIDIVTCKLCWFELWEGDAHALNNKFQKDAVIDINVNCDFLQMSAPSAFIKKDAIKNLFNVNMKYSEDALFINQILLEKCKYGVMSSVIYFYRKRLNHSSAVDFALYDPDCYYSIPKYFYGSMISYSLEKFGKVIPYVQQLLLYDIKLRVRRIIPKGVLSEQQFNEFKLHLSDALKNIDDNIILEQKSIVGVHKLYLLSLKYNTNIFDNLIYKNGSFYFKDNEVYTFNFNKSFFKINVINVSSDCIDVSGRVLCPLPDDSYKIYYSFNGNLKEMNLTNTEYEIQYGMEGILSSSCVFQINEQLKKDEKNVLKFYIKYKNEELLPLFLNFYFWSRLTRDKYSHHEKCGYTVYKENESIVLQKKSTVKSLKLEVLHYLKGIYQLNFKALGYRTFYHFFNIFKTRPIWILSDRSMTAGDNAMHLFKYINKLDDLNADVYFAIDKNSKDYEKMKKYGKVLAYNSLMYKIKFLLSDKIISSQADASVINPFGTSESNYRDILKFDFIFLQHGIIQNDLSSCFYKNGKNIRIFVTSVYDEYKSILTYDYGYDESVVKLTGLPRHDNLKDESEKLIAMMPTWRKNLAGSIHRESGSRDYNPSFKSSDYFKFYNSLINDKKLLDCMKKNGYKGLFVIHPSIEENWIDFEGNDVFEINNGFADYQDIFKRSSLLLSDYSSVLFDFAYLYKPVIYSQFDKEEFFTNHTVKPGYFDYERDGFGPVAYDYDSTVETLIKFIENGCKMEGKYSQRVDKFYKFHDHNNCERVYKEILALK